MEQAFSADVLVPLGVGAAALVVAIVIVIVRAVRSRSRSAAPAEPTHADWTGEDVGAFPEPRAAEAPAREPAMAGAGAPPRPVTVADMVAVREADTAPLPVQSDVLLARARAHRAAAEEAARQAAERSVADQGAAEVEADAVDADAVDAGTAHAGTVEAGTAHAGTHIDAVDTGVDTAESPSGAARAAEAEADTAADGPEEAVAAADAPTAAQRSTPAPRPSLSLLGRETAPVGDTRTRPSDATAPADERPSAAQLAALGVPLAAAMAGRSATSTDAAPTDDAPATAAPVEPTAAAPTSEAVPASAAGPEADTAAGPEADTPAGPKAATPAGPKAATPAGPDAATPAGPEADTPAAEEAMTGARTTAAEAPGADRGVATPAQAWPVVARRAEPEQGDDTTGSSQAISGAVQQALAARARQAGQAVDPRRGDARDRLLAVLLADPVRAVGATLDLQSQQEELAKLAEAMRAQRAELGAVVRRLTAAGLSADQVAKLAGLGPDEVTELLGQAQTG